jgi:hypothetical protein
MPSFHGGHEEILRPAVVQTLRAEKVLPGPAAMAENTDLEAPGSESLRLDPGKRPPHSSDAIMPGTVLASVASTMTPTRAAIWARERSPSFLRILRT